MQAKSDRPDALAPMGQRIGRFRVGPKTSEFADLTRQYFLFSTSYSSRRPAGRCSKGFHTESEC